MLILPCDHILYYISYFRKFLLPYSCTLWCICMCAFVYHFVIFIMPMFVHSYYHLSRETTCIQAVI